jgi:hypothetical protein
VNARSRLACWFSIKTKIAVRKRQQINELQAWTRAVRFLLLLELVRLHERGLLMELVRKAVK